MRTITIIMATTLSLTIPPTTLANKNVKAYCTMFGVSAKHGNQAPVSSEHGFTIINDTGVTKIYHIKFENNILFGGTWYSPNDRKEFDVPIEAGKTYHFGPDRLNKFTYFGMKGNYDMQ